MGEILIGKPLNLGRPGDKIAVQIPGRAKTLTAKAATHINSFNDATVTIDDLGEVMVFCTSSPKLIKQETGRFIKTRPSKPRTNTELFSIKLCYFVETDTRLALFLLTSNTMKPILIWEVELAFLGEWVIDGLRLTNTGVRPENYIISFMAVRRGINSASVAMREAHVYIINALTRYTNNALSFVPEAIDLNFSPTKGYYTTVSYLIAEVDSVKRYKNLIFFKSRVVKEFYTESFFRQPLLPVLPLKYDTSYDDYDTPGALVINNDHERSIAVGRSQNLLFVTYGSEDTSLEIDRSLFPVRDYNSTWIDDTIYCFSLFNSNSFYENSLLFNELLGTLNLDIFRVRGLEVRHVGSKLFPSLSVPLYDGIIRPEAITLFCKNSGVLAFTPAN